MGSFFPLSCGICGGGLSTHSSNLDTWEKSFCHDLSLIFDCSLNVSLRREQPIGLFRRVGFLISATLLCISLLYLC